MPQLYSAFVGELVDIYRNHLAKSWSIEMIEASEGDHRDLLAAYAQEPDLKATLDTRNEKTSFEEAWDCMKGCFLNLRQFCG